MGQIGRPSSVRLTTDEMTSEQFLEFKAGWIRYESILLRRDGVREDIAQRTAESEFARHARNGFQSINAVTLQNRAIRASK